MASPVQLTAPNGVSYTQPTGLFINNEFVPACSGETIATVNPYDESVIASVSSAGSEDVDRAVSAAREAFQNPEWRSLGASERGLLLLRLADLCEKHAETLATIDAWDNGKPYDSALNEDVAEVISVFRYYGGWADKIQGRTIDTSEAKLAYTRHEPIGVCGQIIPWNYPAMMAAWKLGPALACGNTVVLKAAEQTPLSVLYLATLIKEAGFPKGVVNILNGAGGVAGATLASHVGVDKIAFTGSTLTGKAIMKAAAVNLKAITLETGGKSPLLVFDDANLDQAVKWSHVGIMSNMGQICTSTSRIYVQDSIYETFVEQFKKYTVENSVVGSQFDPKVNHGPQVSQVQRDRILRYIEAAKSEGAKLVLGGETSQSDAKGFFVQPTIFKDTNRDMKVVREEVFGPFVVIESFSSQEDAIKKANDTEYGLGAAVFTENITKAHKVAAAIEAGMVWINSSQDSHYAIPFGGYKQSGVGRELGEYALSAYTQVKAVHVNLGTWL
ncbi:aldehyde dehydrogenase [Aspergillus campestris IBT 28561]|uniref:aldehyde dehydrogenase (NAD(+)) n=1 Tax=Aspergillus campestris (strain IBT 28561) TaxID=1392248 RepID=A0A2I1D3Z9_ASPC2|nr:aldehyde dehydrogenase [Aspergillus campestris IBT 28561]PKY04590.1 aldehyde dehydrogenase [Aspergillus campestris IBT 28561]